MSYGKHSPLVEPVEQRKFPVPQLDGTWPGFGSQMLVQGGKNDPIHGDRSVQWSVDDKGRLLKRLQFR